MPAGKNLSHATCQWAEVTSNPLTNTESQNPSHSLKGYCKYLTCAKWKWQIWHIVFVSCEENVIDVIKLVERKATWTPSLTPSFFLMQTLSFVFTLFLETQGQNSISLSNNNVVMNRSWHEVLVGSGKWWRCHRTRYVASNGRQVPHRKWIWCRHSSPFPKRI